MEITARLLRAAGDSIGAATFMVRGYSVIDGRLLVHRLGWSTKFDLARLREAGFSPGATLGSMRVAGVEASRG